MVRYKVTLTGEERSVLEGITGKGKHSSQEFSNACILLNSDEGESGNKSTVEHIAKILHIHVKTVERLKQRFVEEGFERCLFRKSISGSTEYKNGWRF